MPPLLRSSASCCATCRCWTPAPEARPPASCAAPGGALLAPLANLPVELLVAWKVIRYRVPGRQLLDAAVDLPFACRPHPPGWR
ncbi:hypothetical protein ACFQU2_12730 [Siccirubricoccus deserti]